MTRLPTGTVTFLFTDVEGSTQLLEQLGEQYNHVQDRQASIMRRRRSPRAVDSSSAPRATPSSRFFQTHGAAVSAVVQAQRELAAAPWPAGVRPAGPDGAAYRTILGGDNYLGLDVNRAARIAAAAHGEQILMSDVTRSLVERCPHLEPGSGGSGSTGSRPDRA